MSGETNWSGSPITRRVIKVTGYGFITSKHENACISCELGIKMRVFFDKDLTFVCKFVRCIKYMLFARCENTCFFCKEILCYTAQNTQHISTPNVFHQCKYFMILSGCQKIINKIP